MYALEKVSALKLVVNNTDGKDVKPFCLDKT